MTNLKLAPWPHLGGVDASQIEVITTLTRYTDLANNSDKYRRFISVLVPGAQTPYMFTHTGRWTHMTAMGDWSGGTYRPGRPLSGAFWNRNGRNHRQAHNAWVNAKKGDYNPDVPVLTNALNRWANFALTRTDYDGRGTMVGTVVPAGQSAVNVPSVTVQPRPVVPNVNIPVTPRMQSGDIGIRMSNLLARSQDPNVDPFDLLEDVAVLRREVALQRAAVDQLETDVRLANEQIMNRI